jgi:hypothetical protein
MTLPSAWRRLAIVAGGVIVRMSVFLAPRQQPIGGLSWMTGVLTPGLRLTEKES